MAVHEVGHDVVRALHHQQASWVNVRTSRVLTLGEHCDDNTCSMYEVVDVQSPPKSDGHLLLGRKKLYDAGLDPHTKRLRNDWLCEPCKRSVVISDPYREKS